jgi:beta-N-acetylhexosaminidase
MGRRPSRFFLSLILLALLLAWTFPVGVSQAQTTGTDQAAVLKARALLAQMSPEERVGQLFLMTFTGEKVDATAPITNLISQYHIGGVVLLRKNNNLSNQVDIVASTYKLNAALQQLVFSISRSAPDASPAAPSYIPLLIGIPQEGDLYPNDQLMSGMTPLPNLMAIGATWDTNLSQQVGSVMGSELAALGFNLYLGPSLDVLDVQYVSGREDLGVRTFGGDPYWVSELGKAYISGLHQGSNNRLAVIAKHFPGQGGSDRQPEAEIATVRKTFEQLKQIELAPFFAVTSGANPADSVADGLLLSHIRYQGFQRNIRQTTLPISFDRSALNDILSLTELVPWRNGGGLLVSDNLGSPAIKRFFDPIGNRFDARLVARDAFLAGNDLLYVDDFIASGDPDAATTLARTAEFFAQKYREDSTFAQRVDASVERILTLKYRLYPEFLPAAVIPEEAGLQKVGTSQQVTYDVASRAVTLISPDRAELTTVLPRPPQLGERIVFITDTMSGRQCTTCGDTPSLSVDAIQAEVKRLFGPQAGGQVSPSLMTSYSFTDLWRFLNKQVDLPPIENDLMLADWVVFGTMDYSSSRAESQALRQLLSERFDLVRNKRVIAFAFNAPYYLDATDISKLTAYYGLYSKTPAFAQVAALVLFQELTPSGALPVSVPGVGYDLIIATRPDPGQVISLVLDLPETTPEKSATLTPTPVPTFKVGDSIPLKTGLILDTNRHTVPDGTPVRFLFTTGGDSGIAQTLDAVTENGVARTNFRIERAGLLEISVNSDPAYLSDRLRLDITGSESAAITAIVPTQVPTETPTPSPTATLAATPTVTPTPTPQPRPRMGDWALSLAVTLGCAALGLWLGIGLSQVRWGFRWGLCVLIGGLAAYNYLALNLPGSEAIIEKGVTSGTAIVTLVGVIIGAGVGWLWRRYEERGSRLPNGK